MAKVLRRSNRHIRENEMGKTIGLLVSPKYHFLQFLHDHFLNLSVDTALQYAKQFLRLMAQPIDQAALQNVLLSIEEVEKMSVQSSNEDDANGTTMLTESDV